MQSQCRKHMTDSQPVTWQEIKEIISSGKVLTFIACRDSHENSVWSSFLPERNKNEALFEMEEINVMIIIENNKQKIDLHN